MHLTPTKGDADLGKRGCGVSTVDHGATSEMRTDCAPPTQDAGEGQNPAVAAGRHGPVSPESQQYDPSNLALGQQHTTLEEKGGGAARMERGGHGAAEVR